MLMFEMFSSMGLRVRFRPAVLDPQYHDYSKYLNSNNMGSADRFMDNDDSDDSMEDGFPARPVIGKELGFKIEPGLGFEPLEAMEMYNEWAGKTEAPEMRTKQPGEAANQNQKQNLSEYISFSEVHWLNDAGHMEPQLSWIAVSAFRLSPSSPTSAQSQLTLFFFFSWLVRK